jgi:2'-hydroxyisoflavone reductase
VKLLVLGGTRFVGRAAVDAALERGHQVTLFNRGETNPELFPEAEKLRGDRDGDLSALPAREWDAVIDPSGYVPRIVRASTDLLRDAVGLYLFVSSISVYADKSRPANEDSVLEELAEDHSVDELREDYANYGALKVLCEQAVRDVFGERACLVRPGLVVGPHDPTGRFTYWPHRIAAGGDVLVPAPPERNVQFVDVRDLGAWLVDLCEARRAGIYNAVNEGTPWGELVETCSEVAGSDARFVWVPDEFLLENGVEEWMGLPMWIADPEWAAMHEVEVARALAAGLGFRPLADTVRGTLDDAEPTDEAGLTPEREAELLAAWSARA